MVRTSANTRKLRALAAPAATVVALLLLHLAGGLATLDRAWFDLLQRRFAARAPLPADTAIVLIDEQSLRALGSEPYAMRWPWPRAAFAGLLAGLHRAGAATIAVDLLFLEHGEAAEQDLLLGALAAGVPGVVLAATGERTPVFWDEDFRAAHAPLFADRRRWGLVDSRPDRDGVIRGYRLGGSLAEAAAGATRPAETVFPRWRGGLEELRGRGVPLVPAAPFVAAGLALVDEATMRAPGLEPAALLAALEARPRPDGAVFDLVRGRTVFVGANAAGTFDEKATPVGAPEPGVLVHWSAYSSLGDDGFIRPAPSPVAPLLLILVVAAVTFAGWRGAGLGRPALVAGAAVGALGGAGAAAFLLGAWIPPASPALGAAAAFTVVAVEGFRRERARKLEIQGWFGAYVSPAVVRRLVEDPEALRLGGERREVTVFFADIAGFTTLSERLEPERLVAVVNLALDRFSDHLFEERGYIDKYIGDAIMAVFGSPEPLERHALAACRAALGIRRGLVALNEELEPAHGVRLGVRIGINTGEAVVGNVGSERKKNFTVLGDTVNLASRLEGANKEFGTVILLGPETARAVGDALATRPLARLRVKGKSRAVEVHELLGETVAADSDEARFLGHYRTGYAAYCARRFEEALGAFERAAILRPDDPTTARHLGEARRLSRTPPPPEWEPVLSLDSK